jgi:hypothetical protein
MTNPLPYLTTRTASVPVEFFAALRTAISGGDAGIDGLRDAGFQAGQALFDVMSAWLADRGERSPDLLTDERFGVLASQFFEEHGWGAFSLTTISDAVVAIDAPHWIEAEIEGSGCQLSTGLFAGFFGRIADAPLAVLEVECRSNGDGRCRFLVSSVDVLAYVHEAMGRGIPYERAAASA